MEDSSQPRDKGDSGEHSANQSPRPTIVGGRPGGKSRGLAGIPVGIQVLVKKAAVDPEFRTVLLGTRAQAADQIGLELTPAEIATLNGVPRAQLEKIIEHTKVPDEQRRVFLGQLGAAMVAIIGVGLQGCILCGRGGIRPGMFGSEVAVEPVDDEKGRLKFSILDERADSMTLSVEYDCPFEKAEVLAECHVDGRGTVVVTNRRGKPTGVSRGKGKVELMVKGRGSTNWIVIKLRNAAERCVGSHGFWNHPKTPPGEYLVGKCSIVRTSSYHKEWRS